MFRSLILVSTVLLLPLQAFVLKPGERFPELSLPLVGGDKNATVFSVSEGKTILHLFASW